MNPYDAPKTPARSSRSGRGAGGVVEKPFSVECGCGQRVGVGANQAGSRITCACGQAVPVPSLGKLRETVGMGRYESGPADTIRRMLAGGEWPGTVVCARSGRPTEDVLEARVLISSEFLAERKSLAGPLAVGVFGIVAIPLMILIELRKTLRRRTPAPGSEEAIGTPILLEARYHAWATARSGRLRKLLAKSPAYKDLLAEYPHARLAVEGPGGLRIIG